MCPPQLNPPQAINLFQGPDWWYESWGIEDWFNTLFNQPLEVHTFILGAFIGILLVSLIAVSHPRTALTFTLAVLLFTFGAFETVLICSDEFTACQHLRLKPWYFIAGYLSSYLFSKTIVSRVYTQAKKSGKQTVSGQLVDYEQAAVIEDRTVASPLAGLIIIVLVGFAFYSFISPTPVHPITGLATFGGLFGSLFGFAAYDWARADGEPGPTFLTTVKQVLWEEPDSSILVIGYGTVLGFGYPRLFWEAGRLAGQDNFLFGEIIWARNGLPSVTIYVFVLFVLALFFTRIQLRRLGEGRLGGQRFASIVVGFVAYTFCLFVMTGYAGLLWFRVLPSAPL